MQRRIDAHRRIDAERFVGMPDVGGEDGVVLMVVEDEHFGQVFEVRHERMDREFAELLAEGDVLFGRHLGVAEEQHFVVHQRLVNLQRGCVAHGLREVDAAHFGDERWAVGDDVNHEVFS